MQLVDVPRCRAERRIDLLDRAEIEKLSQLLHAHELPKEVAIERERLRAPLLGRRVVLVHVRRDVVEEQRGRERRRRRGLGLDDGERARPDPLQDGVERGQVEHVLQALPERLEHDRELRVAARDLEQVLGLQALLPERSALAGAPARDEQRPGGVLAEARAVERRLRELAEKQILDLVRLEEKVAERRRGIGIREVERDAVVRPERLHVEAERFAQPRPQRHRPGGVHTAAERREDADAPVADLVAETLDDDRPVRGDDAGRGLLIAEERDEVPGGERVEAIVVLHPPDRGLVAERRQLACRLADLLTELGGPPHALALPERRDAGQARGG